VYRQHLDSGIARYENGKLLCAHCVADFERDHDAGRSGSTDVLETISLEEHADRPSPDMSQSRIMASSATLGTVGAWDEGRYRRSLDPNRGGATRCRTFHAKLSDAAIQFMNGQINEWLDANENISIKFATSTIGPFEGKHTEPNLILTVFY
jgi:hypothetical protein